MAINERKLCIIVPIYKETLNKEESLALNHLKSLSKDEKVFLVAPESLNLSAYNCYMWEVRRFSDRYFKNVAGYTRLLLRQQFYECFIQYEYMLICQTDALLLKPVAALYDFMKLPYDYYGAPWVDGAVSYQYAFRGISLIKWLFKARVCYVGNGGFSLRHIRHTIALLEEKKRYTLLWNSGEDTFFAYHGQDNKCGFRIAPVEVAEQFALEQNAKEKIREGALPIGLHAWKKYYPELKLEEFGYAQI